MTSQHGRLYALALALVVFFLTWAVVASHPWATASADPRLRALAIRQAALQHEAKLVQKVVAARWARYRVELKARRAQIARVNAAAAAAAAAATAQVATAAAPAAAGPVQVVNLPAAHVVTRTS
jgi:DNA-binding transcriptional MocR family regulator